MVTARLSSKGRVTIPKQVRDAQNWRAGEELVVIDSEDGVLLRAKRPFRVTHIDMVAACLAYKGEAKSLAEMEAAIKQAVS